MSETTPLIKAALNLRVGAGFDVYGQKQKKRVIMRKYSIQTGKPTFSCPCESLCAIFRPKLRQLPIMECLSLVEEM